MKRLIALSDGTWHGPEQEEGSNIQRLADNIPDRASDGTEQVVFHGVGVGLGRGRLGYLTGGAFGTDIDEKIKALYAFLVDNYVEGDEVYMMGWSRGAYTVRSAAGMIREVGLVRLDLLNDTPKQDAIDSAYELYRKDCGHDDGPDCQELKDFRQSSGEYIPIALVGCFDTVGALGIPEILPFDGFFNRRYQFHNTVLPSIVANGIHIVAIDELKRSFSHTEMHGSLAGQVTEIWMPGDHGDIGDANFIALADIAVNSLLDEMEKRQLRLEVNRDFLTQGDPLATMDKGFDWLRFFFGTEHRKIPQFEVLHLPSVKARYNGLSGYRPPALENFRSLLLE